VKPFTRRAFLGSVLAATIGCTRASPALVVFAAASVEDALREIVDEQRVAGGPEVKLGFAASNVLAQQVAATRAADVFLSADEQWMQWLADRELIEAGTRKNLLGNALVIAARDDSSVRLSSPGELATAGYDRLVLADPESVPVGRYARAFLEGQRLAAGTLWQAVAPRLAPQLDARATVAALLADPRRVGIVYASDLVRAPRLRALYRVPPDAGPRIVYPIAVIAGSQRISAAHAWVDALAGPAARTVFERFGFRVL
jgi:molybdate transport system substrate-binding protein